MLHGDPITKSSFLGVRGSREALTGHPAQVLRYRRLGEEAFARDSPLGHRMAVVFHIPAQGGRWLAGATAVSCVFTMTG